VFIGWAHCRGHGRDGGHMEHARRELGHIDDRSTGSIADLDSVGGEREGRDGERCEHRGGVYNNNDTSVTVHSLALDVASAVRMQLS
jgi:hypothetical protein